MKKQIRQIICAKQLFYGVIERVRETRGEYYAEVKV